MGLLHTSHALAPPWRQGAVLCLVLLIGFALYTGQHSVSTSAELMPAHSYTFGVAPGPDRADHPCDHGAPEYDHKGHVNCASGSGCSFAMAVTQAVMANASSRPAVHPGGAS